MHVCKPDPYLVDHARELGRYALDRMAEMMERHPLIGDVRGSGLLLGIELVKDRSTRERAVDEAEAMKKKGKVSSPKRCFYAPVEE